MREMRLRLLKRPMPVEMTDGKCGERGTVWKALLGVMTVNSDLYLCLCRRGPSPLAGKIDKDVGRTFKKAGGGSKKKKAGEEEQEEEIPINSGRLTRLLNAFVWYQLIAAPHTMTSGYIQGMNCIAGLLLTQMSEVEAFECLRCIALRTLPGYFSSPVYATEVGCRIAMKFLEKADGGLHANLCGNYLDPGLLNQCTLSLMTNVPPLREAVRLWDFFVAFGFHLVPVAVCAFLRSALGELKYGVSEISMPKKEMFDANRVISLALDTIEKVPYTENKELWDELFAHTHLKLQDRPTDKQGEDEKSGDSDTDLDAVDLDW